MRTPETRFNRGVTLVELALVIFIVALLLGTILGPLSVQVHQRELREGQQAIKDVRTALIAYAQARGHLPCPDTGAIDGQADATCTTGTVTQGRLPWVTLGLTPTDRWGRYYGYAVTNEFTNATQPGQLAAAGRLDLADGGCIAINTRGDNKAPISVVIPDTPCGNGATPAAAAVVISYGPNGYCATNLDGGTTSADGWDCATGPASGTVDEYENVNGDSTFVARTPSEGGASCNDAAASAGPLCQFDDQVEWIPDTLLFGKLVEAGQLP